MSHRPDELLEWIEDSTHRAASKALRRYVIGCTTAFLLLLGASGFNYYDSHRQSDQARGAIVQSGSAVSVSGCNRDFRTITSLRLVLTDAKALYEDSLKAGKLTQAEYERGVQYYDDQLERLALPNCHDAGKILTDTPSRAPDVPEALVPDDDTEEGR